MLTTDELHTVLEQAWRDAGVCTRLCSVGGTGDESSYTIHHNGLGPSDTGAQRVNAGWVLKLPEYQLLPWLTTWIIATHNRQHFDLNGRSPALRAR